MLNKRAQKLVDALPKDFEAALIQTDVSMFYLLDFDAHGAGTLLIFPDRMVYIIDSRYIEVAEQEVSDAEVMGEAEVLAQVHDLLREAGAKKLFVENRIPVFALENLREKLPGIAVDAGGTLSGALSSLRAIKDEQEVARMREAQRITDDCFLHIQPFIKEGAREIDLMLEMEHYMRSHGAEKVAFNTIVVAGKNSSKPHGVPGEYRLRKGDFITMDFGAKYKGYCTDMTRTVALGRPSAEQVEIYELVLRAHMAALEASRAGRLGNEVDKVARDMIAEAGHGAHFGHGLGHAVGIEIHEDPRYSPRCKSEIKAGMMMTIEPGVYLPGRFGVRIEDTTLVTETGCVPLPKSEKGLVVL